MSALSENIEKVKELNKIYNIDCDKLKKLISSLKSYSPSIAFIHNTNSVSTRSWSNDNFYLFDEVKGFNLFLIRLLKEYQNLRIKLNNDIEFCMQDLKSVLNSYDQEVLEYEPLSEYARDKFEQDRWSILRPYKDLESLKNEILSDKLTLSVIDEEINRRQSDALKFQNYTLEDLIKESERLLQILTDIAF
jgi:hypothetical protein